MKVPVFALVGYVLATLPILGLSVVSSLSLGGLGVLLAVFVVSGWGVSLYRVYWHGSRRLRQRSKMSYDDAARSITIFVVMVSVALVVVGFLHSGVGGAVYAAGVGLGVYLWSSLVTWAAGLLDYAVFGRR